MNTHKGYRILSTMLCLTLAFALTIGNVNASWTQQAETDFAAIDAYGRVLAQTDFFGSTDRTLVAQVPTQHVATIYTVFGRWFEWLCLIGFLFIVARVLIARRAARS